MLVARTKRSHCTSCSFIGLRFSGHSERVVSEDGRGFGRMRCGIESHYNWGFWVSGTVHHARMGRALVLKTYEVKDIRNKEWWPSTSGWVVPRKKGEPQSWKVTSRIAGGYHRGAANHERELNISVKGLPPKAESQDVAIAMGTSFDIGAARGKLRSTADLKKQDSDNMDIFVKPELPALKAKLKAVEGNGNVQLSEEAPQREPTPRQPPPVAEEATPTTTSEAITTSKAAESVQKMTAQVDLQLSENMQTGEVQVRLSAELVSGEVQVNTTIQERGKLAALSQSSGFAKTPVKHPASAMPIRNIEQQTPPVNRDEWLASLRTDVKPESSWKDWLVIPTMPWDRR